MADTVLLKADRHLELEDSLHSRPKGIRAPGIRLAEGDKLHEVEEGGNLG